MMSYLGFSPIFPCFWFIGDCVCVYVEVNPTRVHVQGNWNLCFSRRLCFLFILLSGGTVVSVLASQQQGPSSSPEPHWWLRFRITNGVHQWRTFLEGVCILQLLFFWWVLNTVLSNWKIFGHFTGQFTLLAVCHFGVFSDVFLFCAAANKRISPSCDYKVLNSILFYSIFSKCMLGFSPGTPASFHCLKICFIN